jgi:uncharacterized protein
MIRRTRGDVRVAFRIARKLRRTIGAEIVDLRLFGSRAKDTARPDSDYDIFIVVKKRDTRVIDEIYRQTNEFELERNIDVSLVVYSEDEYRRRAELGTPFVRSILETGIRL